MVNSLGGAFGTSPVDEIDDEYERAIAEARLVAQEIYGVASDLVDMFNQHPSYWDAEYLAHLHETRDQLRAIRKDARVRYKLRWQRRL